MKKMAIKGTPKIRIIDKEEEETLFEFEGSEDFVEIKETVYSDSPKSDKKKYLEINTLMDLWQKYEEGTLIEVVRCKDCAIGEDEVVNNKVRRYCRVYDEWMDLNAYCYLGYREELKGEEE